MTRSRADSPEACWARFTAAVEAARRDDYDPAHALVERVRERHGNYAAACARRELWAFIRRAERPREVANRSLSPVALVED
ncbi:hypothetical protein AB4Y36_38145 [Paraburkholderia sp. BR10936]|uniref:hypothetical protein n=1 Tax=Paraburkholderia sp. BR10936 TaxID=3236993 RepID=UPI0034D27BDF